MGLKAILQNIKHESNLKDYLATLEKQKDSYQAYIDKMERPSLREVISYKDANDRFVDVYVCPIEKLGKEPVYLDSTAPFIVFVPENGMIVKDIQAIIDSILATNGNIELVYFNEDRTEKGLKRVDPWFKPRWSPDTLLSCLYMGNAIAIKRDALEQIEYGGYDDPYLNLYDIVLKVSENSVPALVNTVVFHGVKDEEADDVLCATSVYDEARKSALSRRGIDADIYQDVFGFSHIIYHHNMERIGIVIPSKDHPKVLERCIKSIRDKSSYANYDIVVVDNGSEEENKAEYEALSIKYDFKYRHEPMEFNFSRMCNTGARLLDVEYYLFLNDDMEVITSNWLELMLGQCRQSHVGAVGAKLLYPDSDLIQHVGVTNMTEGPAHKLLAQSDSVCYYHGVNRVDRDVMATTAACIMLSKQVFDKLGGFCEELEVAYNDVDLCFCLVERGLYIVLRNDVLLYHHESLSRGDDHANADKLLRLKNERDMLYTRHEELYGEDFFYNQYLTGAGDDYICMLPYENRNIKPIESLEPVTDVDLNNINEAFIVKADHMEMEKHALRGDERCMLVDLHAHVAGLDSSDYRYRMLLKCADSFYSVPMLRRYRPDVVKVYSNEKHVELSGFVARIPVGMLPDEHFEVWMEARSIFSRQVLLNKAKM